VHSGTADLGLIDTLAADKGLDTDSDLPPSNVVAHDESPDLEMARKVQQQLLGNIPDIPQLKVALHYEPFHFIGGDFYDFIQLKDRRWFVMLGDVSGHGVQAALVVSSIIKTLRFICQYSQEPDLVEILCTLNDSVRDDMVRGQFATCFAAIVDTRDTVTVECCCCGHHESVITNAYGPVFMRALGSKGMAIGIAKGDLMRRALVPESTELQPGDTLWVYTDGVCGAMNADNEEFEHWRSRAACIAHVDFPLDVQVQNLIGYVLEFTGGVRQDDLSAMALRVPHPDDLTEEEAAALEIDDAEDAV
jgi:serine phosphatase RsbU (regulator of sigma subunit)